jgi:pimeloyl-ACP methyl ester carboxylesterase
MTPLPDADAAAVIKAFVDIPALLERNPSPIVRGWFLDRDSVAESSQSILKYARSIPSRASMITLADTGRTAAAIGGASVTIMEQLGHFPMSENPERFRRCIAPVLNDIL